MYPKFEPAQAKAEEFMQFNLHPRALELAREIARRWPDEAGAWGSLARCCLNLGLADKAVSAAQEGMKRHTPGDSHHEYWCGFVLNLSGTPEQLREAYTRLQETYPNNDVIQDMKNMEAEFGARIDEHFLFQFHREMGNFQDDQKNWGAAACHLQLALKWTDEDDLDKRRSLLKNLKIVLNQLDQEIMASYQEFGLKPNPQDRIPLIRRKEILKEILSEINPRDAKDWNILSSTCFQLEEYDEAIAAAQKALEIEIYDKPHFNIGVSHYNLGGSAIAFSRFQEAVKHFELAKHHLEKALELGGEAPGQALAREELKKVGPSLENARDRQAVFFPHEVIEKIIQGQNKFSRRYLTDFQKGLSPSGAAKMLRQRFDLSKPTDCRQAANELLEDMIPVLVIQVLCHLRTKNLYYENMLIAMGKVASDPNSGAMMRDAEEVLALAVFFSHEDQGGMMDVIGYLSARLQRIVPDPLNFLLKAIDRMFNNQIAVFMNGAIREAAPNGNLPAEYLRENIIWWTPKAGCGESASLISKFFGIFK